MSTDGTESLGRNNSLRARIRNIQRKPSVGSNWSEDSLTREATLGKYLKNIISKLSRRAIICDYWHFSGWLELSLRFDRIGCAVHCSIVRARDLPAMDSEGLADPFCKLTILPAGIYIYIYYTFVNRIKIYITL